MHHSSKALNLTKERKGGENLALLKMYVNFGRKFCLEPNLCSGAYEKSSHVVHSCTFTTSFGPRLSLDKTTETLISQIVAVLYDDYSAGLSDCSDHLTWIHSVMLAKYAEAI